MNGNGQSKSPWGYGVEGTAPAMLQAALSSVGRNGTAPLDLPACNGEFCTWVRRVAECLRDGRCRVAVLFCRDAGLACCVGNKVPGVRAAAVTSVAQACRALDQLGANLLLVDQAGRTFYEYKEFLRLCCSRGPAGCPPELARLLQELDGHAHR